MRISDWSSDVCSSDLLDPDVALLDLPLGERGALLGGAEAGFQGLRAVARGRELRHQAVALLRGQLQLAGGPLRLLARRGGVVLGGLAGEGQRQIGRAHVRTPVTNAHLVCRLLLEKKNISSLQEKQKTMHE